jgi:hypothetical protein
MVYLTRICSALYRQPGQAPLPVYRWRLEAHVRYPARPLKRCLDQVDLDDDRSCDFARLTSLAYSWIDSLKFGSGGENKNIDAMYSTDEELAIATFSHNDALGYPLIQAQY